MFKNYCKLTFRIISRNKIHSFINIAGLAIGMACCLFILIWVQDELSYDKFHENAPYLYRVEENVHVSGRVYHVAFTPYPLAPALKADFSEIIEATQCVELGQGLFRYGEKAFYETGIAVAPAFFRMFTFPFVKGDSRTALDDPFSTVISEEIAEKYFGAEDPIGKVFSVNKEYDMKVTGVMKNIPNNSYLQFDTVVPYALLEKLGAVNDSMGFNSILTFVQLQKGASVQQVNEKIRGFIKKHVQGSGTELELAPYSRIHLRQYFGYGRDMGQIKYVYIFSLIAFFVLLIACINFMNLSTARSANRAKEVGVRKVVGALRSHIIRQFYGESVIYAFIALAFAVMLVALLISPFNNLSGKELSLGILGNWQIILGFIGVTLFTGLVAGSYPALFLSSFQPVRVIKGSLKSGAGSSLFRRILVVVQFAMSIFLIIGTAVVYNQLHYMKKRDVGYDKEHLVYIHMKAETGRFYTALKNALVRDSRILGVTGSFYLPSNILGSSGGADWDGKYPSQRRLIGMCAVDYDYIETLGIELAEGRGFSREYGTDQTEAFLVNEEVAKLMGKESVVGERFSFVGRDGRIIGLMKNFHFESFRNKIEPLAVYMLPPDQRFNYTLIRIPSENISASLDFVKETWQKVVPNFPFEYRFLDDDFENYYRSEERMGDLLKYFSILAVLIACLGLFGLASFTTEQRTKEIGIRKVLGASASQITLLLCREFFVLVLLANIISWPVAYFVMRNWLQDFAYRTSLGVFTFVLTMVLALVIALLTVSYKSIKAATANPVDSLRYE
ncbi:MAG: ABC transporter permease [Candidatus Aminicenantes bacterium]|nr:MAG: ABC transporter permease [Candidatus Aminicenantes bacterium]